MSPALNFRTLDLNLLRVFDVVMAERNLTRAAERLSLTQPAVSNALKRLREAVGEDLLTRSAHGVVPTPRAEALWPEVRSALGRLRGVLAPGEFDPAADAANFRIAMTPPQTLASAVFAQTGQRAVRDVWVSGQPRIVNGRHALDADAQAAFVAARSQLLAGA